jgi:hypothetical protein
VGRGVGAAGQLDDREAQGQEAVMEPYRLGVEQRLGQLAPAQEAVVGPDVDERVGLVHELGQDAQVVAPGRVGQLGRQREDQGRGQCPYVGGRAVLEGVQQGVATGLDVAGVPVEQRADQAGAVAEVVLQRGGVAGTRGAHDLAQADRADALGREQALGRRDQPLPRPLLTHRPPKIAVIMSSPS